jgi:hypothetical protein
MVSEGLNGVPGRAGLGDENLPKGLRRARLVEHASQDAQDGSRPTGANQPGVSAGHEGCGETSPSSWRTTRGKSPPAGSGRQDEQKYRDEFNAEHMPEERVEYEDSVPMDRRPTLPVADVLGAERQEQSWESAPGSRWFQPAVNDRSRGIGDLGMGGLNIGAPAHLQRGRRMLQPAGAAHRWAEVQGSYPAHTQALPREWTTGGGSS